MPRLVKSATLSAALLCAAALLAQPFDASHARRDDDAPETPTHTATTQARADETGLRAARDFGRLPLTFEANRGQAAPHVEYLARGAGHTLMLTRGGALLSLEAGDDSGRAATLRMSFPGARKAARPSGLERSETVSNYLNGRDPRAWVTGVENYTRVGYAGLYEGVSLVFHGTGGRLEYDFHLAAGADAARVRVRFDGAASARLEHDGALSLSTRAGELRQPRPVAYQEEGGARTYVACDYTLSRAGEVGFRLGAYDRSRPLVIDPVLIYSTYLGGALVTPGGVAVDATGNAYVVGSDSTGDVLVLKLNPTGSALVYSTRVGGQGADAGHAVAVDSAGNAYVAGTTASPNFPVSPDAFDKTCGNNGACTDLGSGAQSDAFVFKLNAAGDATVYSTYLGGSGVEPFPSQVNWPMTPEIDVELDAAGNAFVTGSTTSQDFPTTPNAYRTTPGTSFVSKLNPAGSGLVYSTYFPGALAQAVAIDADGRAHITGMTTTSDSNPPTLPLVNAYQPVLGGRFTFDAFVAKLNPEGSALVFSTFLGGRAGAGDTERGGDDYGNDIGLDSFGNVYVAGATRSGCFPSSNPYDIPPICQSGGGPKEFLVKFTPAGQTLVFSKKLTTRVSAEGALSVAPSGLSTVAWSCETSLKVFEACVNRESPSGVTLFTTNFGGTAEERVAGVAVDDAGEVYVTGRTFSTNYPTTPGAFHPARVPGYVDSFLAKLSTSAPEVQFVGGSPVHRWVLYETAEGNGKVTVRVERAGAFASAFSVDYATVDGTAKATTDYAATAGTLHFAPGETFKTFDIFIIDDAYGLEDNDVFFVQLSNPTNGAVLGDEPLAAVHVVSNEFKDGPNPVAWPGLNGAFFVRQHYLDFLSREPDEAGFAFWQNELFNCGVNPACVEARRVNVSAAFFLSIEFQETGYLAYRTYKTAFGDAASPGVEGTVPVIRFNEFLPDTQRLGRGLVVGQTGWETQLEANKNAYALEFVQRPRFLAAFPLSMTAEQFVDKLDANAGGVLSPFERTLLVTQLTPAPADDILRAPVLRKVAEDADLKRREFNRAFVLMEYFGYLRRNPDDAPDGNYAGWKFWLSKLEEFGGDYVRAELVKAFIDSAEYRRRFGP